jgi:hypothetical protein
VYIKVQEEREDKVRTAEEREGVERRSVQSREGRNGGAPSSLAGATREAEAVSGAFTAGGIECILPNVIRSREATNVLAGGEESSTHIDIEVGGSERGDVGRKTRGSVRRRGARRTRVVGEGGRERQEVALGQRREWVRSEGGRRDVIARTGIVAPVVAGAEHVNGEVGGGERRESGGKCDDKVIDIVKVALFWGTSPINSGSRLGLFNRKGCHQQEDQLGLLSEATRLLEKKTWALVISVY